MLRNQLQKFVSSRGKSRKNSRRLRLENLEHRQLLSANFGTAFSIGPSASGWDISTDAAGNTFLLGRVSSTATVDLDPGPGVAMFSGTTDASGNGFVAKYDTDGEFLWATRLAAVNGWDGPQLAPGIDGSVYVAGAFSGSATFGSTTLTSNGGQDAFVAKLGGDGSILWAQRVAGTTADDSGNAVAVDSTGNAYVIGTSFSPGVNTFVAKLDDGGNVSWSKVFGASSSKNGWAKGYGIAVDGLGNVYSTGRLGGTVDFDPGRGVTSATGEAFVLNMSASGNVNWVRSFSKAGGALYNGVEPEGIAVDSAGNVYTTGWFYGNIDFAPGNATTNLTSDNYFNIYVSKLDSAGNSLWAQQAGSLGNNDYVKDLVLDSEANVYVTGSFQGTVDFDPGVGTYNLTSAGAEDVFVWKLDSTGHFGWAAGMGGAGSDSGRGIAVDATGSVFTTGSAIGPNDFDPSPSNAVDVGSGLFVSKLVTVAGPPNQMPTITTNANLTGTQGQLYSYDVNATDPDVGDTLTYSLDTAPSGMTIDANSGIIQWTPVNSQVGANSVTVRVRDVGGLSDTQSFSIAIANVNDAPTITTSPVTTGTEGAAYTYDVDSVDPDTSDTANYSLDAAPFGMTIDSGTGVISWTPQSADVGVSNDVTVRVTDGSGAFDTQSFSVNVSAPSTNQIYVANISFNSKRGDKDWRATFEVRDQDNNPIAGVSITVTFAGIEYQGTTNSSGTYTTPWISNIGNGSHLAEVTDLVLANYDWNQGLGALGDDDGDGLPDAWS